MRTDSTRISPIARNEAVSYIEEKFGKNFVGPSRTSKQQEGAQDVHEAIRPTSVLIEPSSLKDVLSRDQLRLYQLIYDRFLASQMAPAIMDTMTVHLLNNGVEFRATGSKIKFKGFMSVYIEGTDNKKKEEETFLPDLQEGEYVEYKDIKPNQHFTQPPP